MRNFKVKLFSVAFALAVTATTQAQSGDAVTVSGKIWGQFTSNLTQGSTHGNGFDITRALLQAKFKLDATWSGILMIDHDRSVIGSSGTPDAWAYVRNAYVQGSDLWAGGGSLRVGLQPTPWIATVDGVMKTRWIFRSLLDLATVLPSQDGAVSAFGAVGNYFKYTVQLGNGTEGLSAKGNSDSALGVTAVGTLTPFAESSGWMQKLGFSLGLTTVNASQKQPYARNVVAAAAHLESARVDAAVEYVYTRRTGLNRNGFGLTTNVRISEKWSAYGRFFAGNDSFQSLLDAKQIFDFGPTYTVIKDKLQTALTYGIYPQKTGSTEQVLYWKWAATF